MQKVGGHGLLGGVDGLQLGKQAGRWIYIGCAAAHLEHGLHQVHAHRVRLVNACEEALQDN